jgi:hypothetical protein
MADYPSLVKTWLAPTAGPNLALPTTGTQLGDAKALLWAIYQMFIGFATNPMTLVSSNAFGSSSALTWAASGTAHSWIVLKQAGSNAQLLIACSNASSTNLNVSVSPSVGFAGGTTLLDPTASDSFALLTNASWGANAATATYKLQGIQASDGTITRIMICQHETGVGGVVSGYVTLEVPANPVSGWSNPVVGVWLGSSSATQVLTASSLRNAAAFQGRGVSTMSLYCTSEYTSNNYVESLFFAPNDLSQEWPAPPIGLFSLTTSNRGRHGSFYDAWWTPGVFVAVGGVGFSNASAWGYAPFGCLMLPWPSGVPVQYS